MPKPSFTQGPWEFRDGYILANGEALKVVGVQVSMVVGPSRLEAIHNARLIAAAPELLAALADILFEDSGKSEEARLLTRIKARAAVARAEGGAS